VDICNVLFWFKPEGTQEYDQKSQDRERFDRGSDPTLPEYMSESLLLETIC
jgi:hypothetical protein